MHAPPQLGFHLAQLRLQPFAYRLPQHREPSVAPLVSADVREAKEVECLRLPFSVLLPVADRVGAELQKARFLGMQFQLELPNALGKFRPEPLGFRFQLESHHDVIDEPHDDHIAASPPSTQSLDPELKYVVKLDISHKR